MSLKQIDPTRIRAGLEKAKKDLPISEHCPLIKNERWNCRPHDKGNEPFCHSISGYSGCVHYNRYFNFIVAKAIAKEMTGSNEGRKGAAE